MRKWATNGVSPGDVFKVEAGFERRLGHTWAKGRLKEGDHIVALRHTGDSFFDYILLDVSKITRSSGKFLRYDPVPKPFGSYTMGSPVGRLSDGDLAMICGGRSIEMSFAE